MVRKRAYTDSVDRDSYIIMDEHDNNPAELTRSNQFLSLKDACDHEEIAHLTQAVALRSKSTGAMDIDDLHRALKGQMSPDLPSSASQTPAAIHLTKRFSMQDLDEAYVKDAGSPTASWLDMAGSAKSSSPLSKRCSTKSMKSVSRRSTSNSLERVKISEMGCSVQLLGSRISVNSFNVTTPGTLKRINSDPSVAEKEVITKHQEKMMKEAAEVDWRSDSTPRELRRFYRQSECSIPGAVDMLLPDTLDSLLGESCNTESLNSEGESAGGKTNMGYGNTATSCESVGMKNAVQFAANEKTKANNFSHLASSVADIIAEAKSSASPQGNGNIKSSRNTHTKHSAQRNSKKGKGDVCAIM